MNAVEALLTEAQRRHRRRRVQVIVAVVLITVVTGIALLGLYRIGRIEVVISPQEAAETAHVVITEGRGLILKDDVWALKDYLTLRVTTPGFEPEELEVSDTTWARGKVNVVMRELLSQLQVTTDPEIEDTHWYLNEEFVSEGSHLHLRINAGDYTVSARHPFYQTAELDVMAERGKNYEFNLPLQSVEGHLSITSQPDGARVSINSQPVGVTPLNLGMQSGAGTLTIALAGYTSQTTTFEITGNAPEFEHHFNLELADIPVVFSVSPKGGVLSVNDSVTPIQTATSVQFPPNTQIKVSYTKAGYRSKEINFTVNPDQENTVRIDLKPVYGFVEFRSEPQSNVQVGGKSVGKTPLNLQLQTIPQTITFSQTGYRSQQRTVTPDENALQNVFVVLETEQQYRLKNSPQQYTSSVGIEFKLFKNPGSVTIGSPRGEIGRRANEFVRDVKLTKPFYAGIHEVTEGQFKQYSNSEKKESKNRYPVTNIDWLDAAKFANWLSAKEGFTPVYQFAGDEFSGSNPNADGYRMLTEAEWEWLARKAGKNQQTIFPWGNSNTIPSNSGNLADESAKSVVSSFIPNYRDGHAEKSEIGLFQANSVAIHDLAGNVSEWTHSIYSLNPPADNQVEIDALDSGTSLRRTIKGSNWRSATLTELRSAWRDGSVHARDDLGFRLARYLY